MSASQLGYNLVDGEKLTLLESLVGEVFSPGSNNTSLIVLKYVLIALLCSIFATLVTGFTSVHVFILLLITVSLTLAVERFHSELEVANQTSVQAGDASFPPALTPKASPNPILAPCTTVTSPTFRKTL